MKKEKKELPKEHSKNFLELLIEEDIQAAKHDGRILTRFPPEPNGYLHIGHSKSICINFGLAQKYGGKTNLRFDDTNPVKEDTAYVESIKEDVQWLGFNWDKELYASDYFEQLYIYAVDLIKKGLAYVDHQSAEMIAAQKGTPTQPGINSPYRERTIEENLLLFAQMRDGKFKEGECVLRAKIDMASPNMHFRDPLMYRIKFAHHHRTGDQWCIYPMYDFAHGQSDSIENITHSFCTLEFEVHRPLYNWYIEKLNIFPSTQTEFARLNINYTVMSKRKLLRLVQEKLVSGWDDPRMPTIAALRRRGFTPESIREFCDRVGVARRENIIDFGLLEFCIREHLNKIAQRLMVVLDPLKIIITNFAEPNAIAMPAENNPEDKSTGSRTINFGREIFIEREDFLETPIEGYNRLVLGGISRMKHGFIIKADEVIKDDQGKIVALHCTYYPESKSGSDKSGLKPKAVLHWVNAKEAVPVQVNLYDRLFNAESPDAGDEDFLKHLNPDSLKVMDHALAEPAIKNFTKDQKFQFLRLGYFCFDKDSQPHKPILNRTVTLKDTWTKETN
jgi:glutaminyl-tRNA synthetase